mgnify:CR=1 FL=1
MDYGCPLISPELNLGKLVREYILPTGRSCFPVTRETVLEGMITLQQIKKIPKAKWDITSVQDIMTPTSKLKMTYPDQNVLTLLQETDWGGANHMPVTEGGKIIGIVN